MKKTMIIILSILTILLIGYAFVTGDTQNRISRLGVSYFDGDYVISHYGMGETNVWLVIDGKVTSEPDKGYYHTRVITAGKKTAYLQLPMTNTVIEEYINLNQLTSQQKNIMMQKYGEDFLLKVSR